MSYSEGWQLVLKYLSIPEIVLISSVCKFLGKKSKRILDKVCKSLPWVIVVDYNDDVILCNVTIGWFSLKIEEDQPWKIFDEHTMETVILRGKGGEECQKIFKALKCGGYCYVQLNENMHPIGINECGKGVLTKIEVGNMNPPLYNNIKSNRKCLVYSGDNVSNLGKRKRKNLYIK